MVGVTKPFEIAGYLVIKGISPAGYRGIIHIGNDSQVVTIHATNRESEIKVDIKNGFPHFTITAMTEVNVEEKNTDTIPINSTKILEEIARENEHSVKQLLIGLIQKTQKRIRYIRIRRIGKSQKPSYWKSHVKSAEQWGKIYKNVTFDYRVTSKVRRIGMKAE